VVEHALSQFTFCTSEVEQTDFEGLSLSLSSGGEGCYGGNNDKGKDVLDAFFLRKAFSEELTERVEFVVDEVFSVVGQWAVAGRAAEAGPGVPGTARIHSYRAFVAFCFWSLIPNPYDQYMWLTHWFRFCLNEIHCFILPGAAKMETLNPFDILDANDNDDPRS
jgi:hypothetical protein